MSLLLDALKRAEQEKLARGDRPLPGQQAPASANGPADALSLAPLTAAPAPSARPDAQSQAQTIFQAKARPKPPGKSRIGLWIGVGAAVLVLLAGGGYVWYAMNALSPAPLAARRAPPAPIASSVTPAAAGIAARDGNATGLASGTTQAATDAAQLATAGSPGGAAGSTPVAAVVPPLTKREAAMRDVIAESRAAPAKRAAPVSQAPAADAPQILPAVASGYRALREGDLVTAKRQYEAGLATDPRNIDALLGLAAAEGRSGQRSEAGSLYRRALQVDPRNTTALAGLAALTDYARPDMLEPQLRDDLTREPGNPLLHFALGNLLASQARWNDAQSAYFEAYRLDPANADITYNLAVSIDQLGKGRLAADFYRRALEARGPVQFDRASVTRRLAELDVH